MCLRDLMYKRLIKIDLTFDIWFCYVCGIVCLYGKKGTKRKMELETLIVSYHCACIVVFVFSSACLADKIKL